MRNVFLFLIIVLRDILQNTNKCTVNSAQRRMYNRISNHDYSFSKIVCGGLNGPKSKNKRVQHTFMCVVHLVKIKCDVMIHFQVGMRNFPEFPMKHCKTDEVKCSGVFFKLNPINNNNKITLQRIKMKLFPAHIQGHQTKQKSPAVSFD